MRMWEALMDRVKAELMEIAAVFGEKLPVSWKKERMARRVAELLTGDPDRLMMLMSRDTVRCMRSALQAHPDGWVELPEADDQAFEMLHHGAICGVLGLVGTIRGPVDQLGFQMTEEWMELLRSGAGWNEDRAKYLDSVTMCYIGIVRTYGTMRVDDAHAMLCRCFPKEDAALLEWLMKARPEAMELDFVTVEDEDEEAVWVSCVGPAEEFKELYEALKLDMQSVPYRAFTRKQYEFAAIHEWPVYPDGYQNALSMMVRLGMEREDAEDCLNEAIDMRQMEIRMDEDAIRMILESFDWPGLPQMQALVELLIPLMNSVSMWVLKGNSSMDMTRMNENRGAKILPFPGRK